MCAGYNAILRAKAGAESTNGPEGTLAGFPELLPLFFAVGEPYFAGTLPVADINNLVALAIQTGLQTVDFNQQHSFRDYNRSPVGEQMAVEGRRAARSGRGVDLAYPVSNTDRALGTRLSGEIAELTGDAGLPHDTIRVRLAGTAGQSLGAFLHKGISLRLAGTANDYVGKGMGGGLISVTPWVEDSEATPHGGGNACLYGATGGRLFIAGRVGQRFGVRNSGAVAVVEGASDHCAEYMTGGAVAVVGPVRRNVAAGMTGGVLYVWDPTGTGRAHFAPSAPPATRMAPDDEAELRAMLEEHVAETDSATVSALLDRWIDARNEFWVLRALPPQPAALLEVAPSP